MNDFIAQQIEKFKALTLGKKLAIIIAFIVIVGLSSNSNIGRPSECDCRTVMMYEEGAMSAGKRIVGDGYYDNTIPAAQRQCGLKYWNDIKKWQEKKGLYGTPGDNAMEYFMEKCNK